MSAGRPATIGRPAVGDDLELAVAVELVAEQVAEQHRARVELGGDRPEPELVDLEQAQRRRGAAASAAATPPAMFAPARLCTSRVPVRPRIAAIIAAVVVLPLVAETTTLPCGQPRRQPRDRVRLGPHQHLAGQRRAAAARQPRSGSGGARGEQPRLQPHGTITRSAPGSTRTVVGSSAIGSPSA